MSSKSKKLGSLADIYQAEHLDGTITRIRLDRIHPSHEQPRRDRHTGVDELAASIRKDGLLSPLVVTRDGEGYRIIAGERRFHALSRLGAQEAECRIISREERDYWRISIIENLQRENLSAPEEAAALLRLKEQEDYSDAELALVVGKSRNYVTEILGIAALPQDALQACHAAGIENKNLMIQAVQAHRKGHLGDFLEAFQAGAIRTVRSAKEFNRDDAAGSPTAASGTGKAKRALPDRPDADDFDFSIRKNALTVRCPDAESAQALKAWIEKRYF